ncbi:glutamate racemase [Panacibacter sp. DH6]|uniref:Glutamate racemase n=1 Tax=Panacibacter microcysteis TaxID=2793269 RepID=A0A931GTT7_9BACT|nr:glutamate racemase [Panacibacter microcysteis]MBG9375926.1 glutamate racemase [Panacibacter microcysteis]
MQGSIGVFDSGYGGLTVLKEIVAKLPQYDYIYLGDNSRSPYGNRSFNTVYHYTLQCVEWFFRQGCPLVILACNTASAKALRTIQQNDLPRMAPDKRVLGVIRPTTEVVGQYTKSKKVGVLATNGTVQSNSYVIEINKFYPDVQVIQEACPMWVPLVENNEHEGHGADFFIKKNIHQLLKKEPLIDTILLACTHYPLLIKKITEYTPVDITILSQGKIVANSLADYLKRHNEMETRLSKNGQKIFYTTDSTADFDKHAAAFYGRPVSAIHTDLS